MEATNLSSLRLVFNSPPTTTTLSSLRRLPLPRRYAAIVVQPHLHVIHDALFRLLHPLSSQPTGRMSDLTPDFSRDRTHEMTLTIHGASYESLGSEVRGNQRCVFALVHLIGSNTSLDFTVYSDNPTDDHYIPSPVFLRSLPPRQKLIYLCKRRKFQPFVSVLDSLRC